VPRWKNAVFPGVYETAWFSDGYILSNKCFFLFQNVSKCFKMSRCVALSIKSSTYIRARYKKLYQEKGFQPEKGCKVNFSWKKLSFFSGIQKFILFKKKYNFLNPPETGTIFETYQYMRTYGPHITISRYPDIDF
jgi:hypothetical protein